MLSKHAYRMKPSTDETFSSSSSGIMEELFRSLPNLNLSSAGSSYFTENTCSPFVDSGLGSPEGNEPPKVSRWARMDIKLLNQDFRKFLKKNVLNDRLDKSADAGVRKASNVKLGKKRVSWCNDVDSGNEDEVTINFKQLISS